MVTILKKLAPGLIEVPDDAEVDEDGVRRATEAGEDPEAKTAEPVLRSQAPVPSSSR